MYELGGAFGDARVPPGTNLLIAGPPMTGKRRLAFELLAHGANSDEGAIVVTVDSGADRVLAEFEAHVDREDAPVGIVDCVTEHHGMGTPRDVPAVRYASSPVDMTGIGIHFSEFIDEFRDERGLRRNRVLLDSLTTLLMYSNLETVFRFLHVFTSRIQTSEALGLYILESTAHDERVQNTVSQLFEGVVRTSEDGEADLRLSGGEQDAVDGD